MVFSMSSFQFCLCWHQRRAEQAVAWFLTGIGWSWTSSPSRSGNLKLKDSGIFWPVRHWEQKLLVKVKSNLICEYFFTGLLLSIINLLKLLPNLNLWLPLEYLGTFKAFFCTLLDEKCSQTISNICATWQAPSMDLLAFHSLFFSLGKKKICWERVKSFLTHACDWQFHSYQDGDGKGRTWAVSSQTDFWGVCFFLCQPDWQGMGRCWSGLVVQQHPFLVISWTGCCGHQQLLQ